MLLFAQLDNLSSSLANGTSDFQIVQEVEIDQMGGARRSSHLDEDSIEAELSKLPLGGSTSHYVRYKLQDGKHVKIWECGICETYKRKKENLKPLTEDLLTQARALKETGISFREIGRTLDYDESTIRKRLKIASGVSSLGRFRPVFTAMQGKQIVDHCKALDLRFYGLTLKSLRFLAYQYAERNSITHTFNNETKLAGRDWTRQFMKRNRLSLRTPRKTSVARTMGFNKQQLSQYFQNLKTVLDNI
nr:unnamed protein product [Callosobruchus analis]